MSEVIIRRIDGLVTEGYAFDLKTGLRRGSLDSLGTVNDNYNRGEKGT